MNRFLLFAGDHYYPAGGWVDFKDSFLTLENAKDAAAKTYAREDWYHIIDTETGEIVDQKL